MFIPDQSGYNWSITRSIDNAGLVDIPLYLLTLPDSNENYSFYDVGITKATVRLVVHEHNVNRENLQNCLKHFMPED